MTQTENVRKAAAELLAAQELVKQASARLNEEVSRFVQTPDGMRELAQFLATRDADRVVADAANTAPANQAPAQPAQAAPTRPARQATARPMPQTIGSAIHAWFPPAPQTATIKDVVDLLESNGFKFASYQTDARQLINAYLWQHSRVFRRVGHGTYQRVR